MLNTRLLLVVSVVCLIVVAAVWSFRPRRAAGAQVTTDAATAAWQSRWLRVEEKAGSAEAGDADSISQLANEVFGQAHLFGTLPDAVKDSVQERVISAELRYRSGGGRASTHSDVARMINWVADTLALPSYARTSEHQILDVRFRSLMLTPRFMGKGLSAGEDSAPLTVGGFGAPLTVGGSVNPAMSPLQACYLAMFAMDAKMGNPDYQVAPEEWERLRYQETLNKWQDYLREQERAMPAQRQVGSQPKLVARSGSKRLELGRAVEAHLEELSVDQSIGLAQSALDALGIERMMPDPEGGK